MATIDLSADHKMAVNEETRRFLSDEEFRKLKEQLEHSFFESARLVPTFDSEKEAITEDQAAQLLPFLFKRVTPYYLSVRHLEQHISACVDKIHSRQF
jgi:hypothetical protein